jgi:hypothetical protein
MTLETFARLAEIWGGALDRWPSGHRAEAAALVACSAEAAAILERERALDSALDADPAPALPAALTARMLADAAAVAGERSARSMRPETDPAAGRRSLDGRSLDGRTFGDRLRDLVRALGGGAVAAGLGGAATFAAAAGFAIGLETQTTTTDDVTIAMSETIFTGALTMAEETDESSVFSFGDDASL